MIEGTVIRLEVDRLPSGAIPKPVWLWWSKVDATPDDVDRMWQAFRHHGDQRESHYEETEDEEANQAAPKTHGLKIKLGPVS